MGASDCFAIRGDIRVMPRRAEDATKRVTVPSVQRLNRCHVD